jgi:hypothetical protein
MSQFYTILACCKSQIVYRHFGGFLVFLSGRSKESRFIDPRQMQVPWESLKKAAAELPHSILVGGRLVAEAAIFFTRGQVPDAEFRKVSLIALENLL